MAHLCGALPENTPKGRTSPSLGRVIRHDPSNILSLQSPHSYHIEMPPHNGVTSHCNVVPTPKSNKTRTREMMMSLARHEYESNVEAEKGSE